ncbi:MAG: hypothetical protein ACREBK_03060 [Sphingomicrobium sp.]
MRRHIGASGITFTNARIGQTLHLPCSHDHTVDYPVRGAMPPEKVAKNLLNKGWIVGHRLTCPEHARKPKAVAQKCGTRAEPIFEQPKLLTKPPREKLPSAHGRPPILHQKIIEALSQFPTLTGTEITDLVMHTPNGTYRSLKRLIVQGAIEVVGGAKQSRHDPSRYALATKKDAPPMSDPAPANDQSSASDQLRAAKRLAHMMLEEQFDVAKGCFNNGYCDKKIASETGVSEAWVKGRREEEFGPLKVPSDLHAIEQKIAAMHKRLTDELARIQSEAATAIGNLARDVGKIATRLETLVQRNGWKS